MSSLFRQLSGTPLSTTSVAPVSQPTLVPRWEQVHLPPSYFSTFNSTRCLCGSALRTSRWSVRLPSQTRPPPPSTEINRVATPWRRVAPPTTGSSSSHQLKDLQKKSGQQLSIYLLLQLNGSHLNNWLLSGRRVPEFLFFVLLN